MYIVALKLSKKEHTIADAAKCFMLSLSLLLARVTQDSTICFISWGILAPVTAIDMKTKLDLIFCVYPSPLLSQTIEPNGHDASSVTWLC